MTKRPNFLLADLSLLLVTAIWGSTFVIVKAALEDLPPNLFIALRFSLAAACLAVWGGGRSWLRPEVLRAGLVSGLFLAGGYIFQTIGLIYTTPAKAGFITGLSVVLVPIFLAVSKRQWPGRPIALGVGLALIGLGLLSLGPNLSLSFGDFLVLLCALCFALQIITVGRFVQSVDARSLTGVQLLVVALLSGILSLFEQRPSGLPSTTIWAILFTAVVATALAFLLQSQMQRFTSSSHTALIFAAEPVFAAGFSYFWCGEGLGLRGVFGAICILAGILTAEVGPLLNSKESLPSTPEVESTDEPG